jgi:hypothetical protein
VSGAVWLEGDLLRAGVVPALGGRLLSLRLGERELLHRDPDLLDSALRPTGADGALGALDGTMATWRNWGGDKTWPAPQGWDGPDQWAGPPDPILDGGPYSAAVEPLSVALTSAPDPRTGVRIHRRLRLDPRRAVLHLDLAFENVARGPVRWAIWNVTQVPGAPPGDGGGVFVGVDDPNPVTLFAATGTPRHRTPAVGVAYVPHQDVVGKLGFPGATGWIAHAARGAVLSQRWAVDRAAPYPDGGARAEVWMEHPQPAPLVELGGLQPRHRVVEIEALGPLVDLEPGARTTLSLAVGACCCPPPVVAVGEHGCIAQPLRVVAGGDGWATVEAVAGTFARGEAWLAWCDAAGARVGTTALGRCGPETPVRVDVRVPVPRGAASVRLLVDDAQLDQAAVEHPQTACLQAPGDLAGLPTREEAENLLADRTDVDR